MKIPVLKALANPARIFFVPYNLAVLNLLVWMIIFFVIFISVLIFTGKGINPLSFMIILTTTHSIIAVWAKKEPFLSRIIATKINLFKHRIPNKMMP